jgi:hypothetical protein
MLATSQEFNAAMPAVTRMRPPSPVCRIRRRAQVATGRGYHGVARSAARRASRPSAVRTSHHRVGRQRRLRTRPSPAVPVLASTKPSTPIAPSRQASSTRHSAISMSPAARIASSASASVNDAAWPLFFVSRP